jgi:hypothetical protein
VVVDDYLRTTAEHILCRWRYHRAMTGAERQLIARIALKTLYSAWASATPIRSSPMEGSLIRNTQRGPDRVQASP